MGIAAAPDFTDRLYTRELTPAQRATLEAEGRVVVPSVYEDDYVFTKALIEDGREHMVMYAGLPIDCPVRLIHGLKDEAVPWQTAQAIAGRLRSEDVEVTLVKNGDHRLSEPHDLERLTGIVGRLLDGLGQGG